MTGRILIVDTVPTNRIVLKVKMLAAQFKVATCANRQEAEDQITRNCPDLILMNLSDTSEDKHAFCRDLKQDAQTKDIAVISVGVADTTQARFAALDAGADDVFPRPINDALLLARIRSLLRVRHARQELVLRDGTSRALGFDDARIGFVAAARVTLLTNGHAGQAIARHLDDGLNAPVTHIDTDAVLSDQIATPPDLIVIDASAERDGGHHVCRQISDLRSRKDTRLSSILVILPQDEPDIAALVLDLGADDVSFANVSRGELILRAKALIKQKLLQDTLRDAVRNGLTAAVTDPLTGLYNRRYVDSHLIRMADQARKTQREFAVMILDIDHFKLINDKYGHAAGDKVLIKIAQRLRDTARDIDLVARIGGEEFMVALPNTDHAQCHVAADRLRKIISARPFSLGPDQPALRVTVSVGVATGGLNTPDHCQIGAMCDRADAALYTAKSAGRDTVAISEVTAA